MVKIVSKNDGYSLFFEKDENDDEINCIAYETGKHLTGQEIGDYLNVSRSAVSQSLKRSIKRIFYKLKKNNMFSTVEIIANMAVIFNVNTESEYKNFFRLFPDNIKGKFYEEACKIGYYKN